MFTLETDKEDIGGKSDESALSKRKTVIIDDANSKVVKYFLFTIFFCHQLFVGFVDFGKSIFERKKNSFHILL